MYTESILLFYDIDTNRFVDEDGFIVWSIFDIVTPNDLFLFKREKDYMLIHHRSIPGVLVEIYYPDD